MTVAAVELWGTRIGAVALTQPSGVASFQYDPAFLASGIQLAPLMMPLSDRIFNFPELPPRTFRGLPGLLADSLPDRFGNSLINAWLARQGHSPSSFDAVERLCYTGRRGMGALEFVPAQGPGAEASGAIQLSELEFRRGDLEAIGRVAQLVRGRLRAIAEEVLTAVRSWPRFAEEAGIDEPVQASIQATHRLNLLDP
jgi:serine/threonine-protein kinase HipA